MQLVLIRCARADCSENSQSERRIQGRVLTPLFALSHGAKGQFGESMIR